MKSLGLISLDGGHDVSGFAQRLAARAVVFDNDNHIALLHVSKSGYYKLPGGGIENGEDKIKALKRECAEEIGCNVDVVEEVGQVVEYKVKFSFTQISYCYVARLIGEKGIPDFTDHEKEFGFEAPIWVPLSKAIELVSNSNTDDYEGRFIKERDTLILKEVEQSKISL